MRKNNWIFAAVAAVAAIVLVRLWLAFGFNRIDSPVDPLVAVAWLLVIAGVAAGITWAERKRRARMRLAFVGRGVIYNPEVGLVTIGQGESELAALQRTLANMTFPDEVAELDASRRPAFRWVVRSSKFDRGGDVWEGEVLSARSSGSSPVPFSNRSELARLISTAA